MLDIALLKDVVLKKGDAPREAIGSGSWLSRA